MRRISEASIGVTILAAALAWPASPAGAVSVIANSSNVNTFAVFHESNSDPEDQDQQVQGATLNPLSAHTSLTGSSLSYDLDASATWANPTAGTVELDYLLGNDEVFPGPGFAGQAQFLYQFTVDTPTQIDLDYNIHAESTYPSTATTHPISIWWNGGNTRAALLQNGFPINQEQYPLYQLAGAGVNEINHVGSTILNIPAAGAYVLRLEVGGGATGPQRGSHLTNAVFNFQIGEPEPPLALVPTPAAVGTGLVGLALLALRRGPHRSSIE